MNHIEKLENCSFHVESILTQINELVEGIKDKDTNYYVDSKLLLKAYLLYTELILSVLKGELSKEEIDHFKRYFITEKMGVIDQIFKKVGNY